MCDAEVPTRERLPEGSFSNEVVVPRRIVAQVDKDRAVSVESDEGSCEVVEDVKGFGIELRERRGDRSGCDSREEEGGLDEP